MSDTQLKRKQTYLVQIDDSIRLALKRALERDVASHPEDNLYDNVYPSKDDAPFDLRRMVIGFLETLPEDEKKCEEVREGEVMVDQTIHGWVL